VRGDNHATVGLGLNAKELAANPRLGWLIRDLNTIPVLPRDDGSFDAACLDVSEQYLQRSVEVSREVAGVLLPGSPFFVSFPTDASWQIGRDPASTVQGGITAAGYSLCKGRGVYRCLRGSRRRAL
jgi:SAM-dependent methyltransferase